MCDLDDIHNIDREDWPYCFGHYPDGSKGLKRVLAWIYAWLTAWAGRGAPYQAGPNPEDIYEPNREWRRLNKHKIPLGFNLRPFYVIYGRDLKPYQFLTKVARVSGMGRVLIFMLYAKRAIRIRRALSAYRGIKRRRESQVALGLLCIGVWSAHLWPS